MGETRRHMSGPRISAVCPDPGILGILGSLLCWVDPLCCGVGGILDSWPCSVWECDCVGGVVLSVAGACACGCSSLVQRPLSVQGSCLGRHTSDASRWAESIACAVSLPPFLPLARRTTLFALARAAVALPKRCLPRLSLFARCRILLLVHALHTLVARPLLHHRSGTLTVAEACTIIFFSFVLFPLRPPLVLHSFTIIVSTEFITN